MTYNQSLTTTSFADSVKLLRYLAYKCGQRLYALGILELDEEDLYQDGCLIYTKAVKTYNPETGVPFNAYLRRAVLLEFNNKVQHMIEIRNSMRVVDIKDEDGENLLDSDYFIGNTEHDAYHYSGETPEDLAVRSDEIRERVAGLSPLGKLFVRELISPSAEVKRTLAAMQAHADFAKTMNQNIHRPKDVSVKVIRKHYSVDASQYRALKNEFLMKLGVSIGSE